MASKQFWVVVAVVLVIAAFYAWNNDRYLDASGRQLDRDLAAARRH